MHKQLGWAGYEQIGKLNQILNLLQDDRVDYCVFFRNPYIAKDLFLNRDAYIKWVNEVKDLQVVPTQNPKYILRNYLAERAIRGAQAGNCKEVDKLLKILRKPYDEQPEYEAYAKESPDWGKNLEISCSS